MDNNLLYSDLANIYDVIADDRNFQLECDEINQLYCESNTGSTPRRVLELFAGPCYHAEVFRRQYGCDVVAVDSSQQMKDVACQQQRVLDHQFYVGSLPAVISEPSFPSSFDIVLIMRYSLGLIDYDQAESLFIQLEQQMRAGGIIIIELHHLHFLLNNFTELTIKTREKQLNHSNEKLRCTWPSGPLRWDEQSWKVHMPLKIEHVISADEVKTYTTESSETIYRSSDILRMVRNLSFTQISVPTYSAQQAAAWVVLQKN